MVELLPSDPNDNLNRAGPHPSRRVLVVALASLLVLGGSVIWRASVSRPVPEQAKLVAPARDPVLDQLVENTKALEVSQQQAIDQLQVLQDLVRVQQAESKKASDRVAALNARLDTMQQAFASLAPPVAEEVAPEKAEPQARSRAQARVKVASRSSRAKRHRTARRR
jgi:hypothetical protein